MSTVQFVSQTPRDFLASLTPPLAIPNSRGRFSKDGVAALEAARAQGFVFIGDAGHPDTEVKAPKATTPKAPKKTVTVPAAPVSTGTVPAPAAAVTNPQGGRVVPAPGAHPAAATASFSAKEVRAWAKANGHAVGKRGRLNPTVIAAFAKAGGKPVGDRAKPAAPAGPAKVRPERVGYLVENGATIALTKCGGKGVGCQKTIQSCTCKTGPVAPHYVSADLVGTPLSLVKPTV